jgi:hypothetical protein
MQIAQFGRLKALVRANLGTENSLYWAIFSLLLCTVYEKTAKVLCVGEQLLASSAFGYRKLLPQH